MLFTISGNVFDGCDLNKAIHGRCMNPMQCERVILDNITLPVSASARNTPFGNQHTRRIKLRCGGS